VLSHPGTGSRPMEARWLVHASEISRGMGGISGHLEKVARGRV
jgi:hypothetical protein